MLISSNQMLEQTDRPVQVLQPVLTDVYQREALLLPLLLVLDQGLRGLGEQHLTAAGRGADPRRAMHRQAGIGLVRRNRVAGVNAHPHPDPGTVGPVVGGERALHLERAQHSLSGLAERGEERVALGVDLVPAMTGDGRADQPPVLGQHLPVPVPQRLDQPG